MSCATDTLEHVDSTSIEAEEFVLGVWSYDIEGNDINVTDCVSIDHRRLVCIDKKRWRILPQLLQ